MILAVRRSIGLKVLGAFFAAILPLIGLIISCNLSMQNDALTFARFQIARAMSETAADQNDTVTELREMLGLVAALEAARKPDLPALEPLLRQIKEKKAYLANLFLCDLGGTVEASVNPASIGLDVSQRKYFRDPLRRDGFSFGHYLVSRVTRTPVMHFSVPVRGLDGQPSGVLVAALDLAGYARQFERLGLPDGGFLEIYDSQGLLLSRHPATPDAPPGQPMPADLAQRLTRDPGGEPFAWHAPGQPGQLLAARPLRAGSQDPETYGTMLVGLPLALAMEAADRRLRVSTVVSALSVLVAIGLAVGLGRKVIVDRLRVLTDLVGEVERGQVCLLPRDFGEDEIGLLGRRFAGLSRELHEKSHTLVETLDSLRQEKNRLETVVGQLGQVQEELMRQANHDALTGLGNRRAFNESLSREFARNRRYGTIFSLVLFDIDDFKVVNDTHGHCAGDEALRQMSRRVTACLRETDAAFRVGGEEFALILPETGADQALALAERARRAVAAPTLRLSGVAGGLTLTISLGLAACDTAIPGRKELYKAADQALYRAKATGKNRSVTWPVADRAG